jgi:hypothetical protein
MTRNATTIARPVALAVLKIARLVEVPVPLVLCQIDVYFKEKN